MWIWCGGIFNYHFTANLSLESNSERILKIVKISPSYLQEYGGLLFWNSVFVAEDKFRSCKQCSGTFDFHKNTCQAQQSVL